MKPGGVWKIRYSHIMVSKQRKCEFKYLLLVSGLLRILLPEWTTRGISSKQKCKCDRINKLQSYYKQSRQAKLVFHFQYCFFSCFQLYNKSKSQHQQGSPVVMFQVGQYLKMQWKTGYFVQSLSRREKKRLNKQKSYQAVPFPKTTYITR